MADEKCEHLHELDSVQLIPEDIPGAAVSDKEIGKLNLNQLKFWLKCRRIKQSGNKKELYERVRNLNDILEVREKVYDPDPNKVYTKAKIAKLKFENATNNSSCSQEKEEPIKFPSDDVKFNKDFSVLPDFTPTDTLDHLKNCGKTTKKSACDDAVTDLSSSKGLRLLPFVHNMEVSKANESDLDLVYIRALCWASYRKSVKYKVKLIVNSTSKPKIKSAQCDKICPAAKIGCCCHVMAVIWKLDEMTRNKQLKKTIENDRSCTSKPRKWGIPSGKREVHHRPVMASKIVKPRHQTDIPGRKRRGVLSTFYDPRPAKSRKLDPEEVVKFRDDICQINPNIPFAKMTPDSHKITLVNTVVGLVARGSVLHLQLKDYNVATDLTNSSILSLQTSQLENKQVNGETFQDENSSNQNESKHNNSDFPFISPPKQQPVSLDDIKERCERIKQNLFVDENKINEMEMETRDQSDNPKWFQHRLGRITASKCYRVACNHRASTSPTKIIREVLNYHKKVQTKAMRDGLKYETLATDQYVKKMHQQGHSGLKVESCGFFVLRKCGIIGASPDGLVTDPTAENPQGTLEIKNINVQDNKTIGCTN